MSVPTYDAVKLPSHVETVLITGAGGFVGAQLTQLLLDLFPKVKIITTDIVEPPRLTSDERLKVVKADLGDIKQVQGLFEGQKIGGIFALHGIMSGGSEANFPLGYAVNVDSHVNLLKVAHEHAKKHFAQGPKPRYVFVSSLAVYGGPKARPESFVKPEETPAVAETSYGCQKQIIELYTYDYGRKGFLETRSCRLPTVAIRSGAPSTAASSFISGLIREPLQGQPSVCPIATSADDPIMDSLAVYISRTKTVVRNIAYALCMSDDKFKGRVMGRTINLPGISITPKQILKALEEHGGAEAMKLVSYEKDEKVIRICETWAGDYDSSEVESLGFEVDDKKTGFSGAVQDFKKTLKA